MVYIYIYIYIYEFCSKGYNYYRRERLRGISRHQFTERDIQTLCMRLCEVVQQGLGGKVGGISRDRLVERYKPKCLHPHPHQYHCCNKDWKRRERKISVSTKVQIRVWGSANLGS